MSSYSDNCSTDSQFTNDEELTFLEACTDCDEDALYDIIQDGTTWEQVNERDKSGRVGLHMPYNSHRFMRVLTNLSWETDCYHGEVIVAIESNCCHGEVIVATGK